MASSEIQSHRLSFRVHIIRTCCPSGYSKVNIDQADYVNTLHLTLPVSIDFPLHFNSNWINLVISRSSHLPQILISFLSKTKFSTFYLQFIPVPFCCSVSCFSSWWLQTLLFPTGIFSWYSQIFRKMLWKNLNKFFWPTQYVTITLTGKRSSTLCQPQSVPFFIFLPITAFTASSSPANPQSNDRMALATFHWVVRTNRQSCHFIFIGCDGWLLTLWLFGYIYAPCLGLW